MSGVCGREARRKTFLTKKTSFLGKALKQYKIYQKHVLWSDENQGELLAIIPKDIFRAKKQKMKQKNTTTQHITQSTPPPQ